MPLCLTSRLRWSFLAQTSSGAALDGFGRCVLMPLVIVAVLVAGCSDDSDTVRQIQAQRQVRMQNEAQQDHLGEVTGLLKRYVELNPDKARRQIAYHLNRWDEMLSGSVATGGSATSESKGEPSDVFEIPPDAAQMLKTLSHVMPLEKSLELTSQRHFLTSDINHLRDAYLFRQISEWADRESCDEPLLEGWLKQFAEDKGTESADQLRTATRLFDWTVRNIAFEPLEPIDPAPPGPSFPFGMNFRGAGYRQSDYQALWHGSGDALKRAGVFTQLCRQASIPAAVLALPKADTGELRPWCVGAMIGSDLYLFEPELGMYVPGPGQVGIATLSDARRDASVMRRLNVAGFFEYPYSKDDIQQCVALLNVMPEGLCPRMQRLEQGLTGDRRMTLYVDAVAMAKELDAVSGVSGVRLWDVPLLAEVYRATLEQAAERDPMLQFWYMSRWAILDANVGNSRQLANGRWTHLRGQFDDDDIEGEKGARTQYLAMRAPEFEIEDLRIDVELQIQYGIRRDLGIAPDVYDRQVQQIQAMMRQGKRTATYWLSLVQYEDGRFDTADSWLTSRVLVDEQRSQWEPAARYNLARTLERLGQTEKSIELYKTNGDPQEHGNRIRARLLDRSSEDAGE